MTVRTVLATHKPLTAAYRTFTTWSPPVVAAMYS
jgi:hypothetical protein